MFPISPEKEKTLKSKLDSLGIYEKDIEESFVRSGGKGGQNVNKVATCVYLKHLPTGTEVKCSKARTQGLNRYYARVLLYEKIERQIKGSESKEEQRIEKIRRQSVNAQSGPKKRCLMRKSCSQ